MDVRLLAPLTPAEVDTVATVAEQMGRYLDRPVEVIGMDTSRREIG
jgi:hypothetical protein